MVSGVARGVPISYACPSFSRMRSTYRRKCELPSCGSLTSTSRLVTPTRMPGLIGDLYGEGESVKALDDAEQVLRWVDETWEALQ